MASKNYLSSDYVTRRGGILKPSGISNSSQTMNTYETGNVVLGQPGLTKSSANASDFNFAKQFLVSKGVDEVAANTMALTLLDVAKLKNEKIQVTLYNLYEGKTKVIDTIDVAEDTFHCVKHGYETGKAIYFTPKTGTSIPTGIYEYEDSGKNKIYYVIAVDNNNFKVAETDLSARRNIWVDISAQPIAGVFEVHERVDLTLDMDQYIYMNAIRPKTNQLGVMTRTDLTASVRFKQINP